MTLSQIATLLNQALVPNALGESTTIAEDLRNVVDLGTKIADMDANTLKDYAQKFAIGVIENWVDTRKYNAETYGIFIDAIEYGGAVQRTRAKLLSATDTPILSLVSADNNGPDYNDGKYYGTGTESTLITKDVAFQIKFSIPVEMFKKSFTDARGVQKLVSLIENNAENTLNLELNTLAKGLLRKLALACNTSRKINLISTYNTQHGYTSSDVGYYVTLDNWDTDTNFKLWCQSVIIMLRKYVTDYNQKYGGDSTNDISVFCPESDTRVVLLSAFANELDFAQSSVFHNELTSVGNYSTINYWQNGSTDLLPAIGSGSTFDQIKEKVADSGSSQTTTIDHVVGLIFDKYTMGITDKLDKMTSAYIPAGDFNTFFGHHVKSYWLDPLATGVVLCLA